MTRVVITGAGGFIGSHVLRHMLTETDWDVTAVDSFRHKGKTDRIWQQVHDLEDAASRLQVIVHDLAAPVSPQLAERIGTVDYILALASESHVERSLTDPDGFCRNNHEIALSTLGYARRARPKALIWVSTDEVYGPVSKNGGGHAEWSPILPSNPYAASKAAQEALAISYWRSFTLPLVIVNCMNLVGELQDPEKFLPMLISRISSGREVTIHGEPGNIGSRHYLHARNLADAMLFILQNLPPALYGTGTGPGAMLRPDRYNIAGPNRVSNLDLAFKVAEITGRPLKYRLADFHSTRPGHDPHYGLDPGKIRALGWKPPVPFVPSLEKTVKWTLQHPQWLREDDEMAGKDITDQGRGQSERRGGERPADWKGPLPPVPDQPQGQSVIEDSEEMHADADWAGE